LCGGDQMVVIEIVADAVSIIDRLVGRLMCPGCGDIYNRYSRAPLTTDVCDRCGKQLVTRSDDKEELIKERFKHYKNETYPLVDHYQRKGCYFQVDGMRPIPDVTAEILAIVNAKEASTPREGKRSLA
jgi:adenylate kinase